MAFTGVYREFQTPLQVKNLPITPTSTPILISIPEIEIDQTDSFLDAIANAESSNRYKVTNRFGYMGKPFLPTCRA